MQRHCRAANVQAARNEEAGAGHAIQHQQNTAAQQHRKRKQRQDGRGEPGPASQRHAHQRHAPRAHVEQRRDKIQSAQQRPDAEDRDANDPKIDPGALPRPGDFAERAQRRIPGPTANWSNGAAASGP